ncbi:MAG: Hsp20/alpha crystallin family protein [Acidobacteria bacterium]|nr:Hsp20/alpha crystallin family protein [Acidobacteriota bacterium]
MSQPGRAGAGRPAEHAEAQAGPWSPAMDIFEIDDRIVLRADLPGVAGEDIEVRVEEGVLVLRGQRCPAGDVRPEEMHRAERPHGSFVRSFSLPQSVDQARIRATHRNGVLEIVLPKIQESKAKSITIEVER